MVQGESQKGSHGTENANILLGKSVRLLRSEQSDPAVVPVSCVEIDVKLVVYLLGSQEIAVESAGYEGVIVDHFLQTNHPSHIVSSGNQLNRIISMEVFFVLFYVFLLKVDFNAARGIAWKEKYGAFHINFLE
jgi:hypothetical protein